MPNIQLERLCEIKELKKIKEYHTKELRKVKLKIQRIESLADKPLVYTAKRKHWEDNNIETPWKVFDEWYVECDRCHYYYNEPDCVCLYEVAK